MCTSVIFNVAPTRYMSTGIWSRLAALATHGRQNCKQSGVVLERTGNSPRNEKIHCTPPSDKRKPD